MRISCTLPTIVIWVKYTLSKRLPPGENRGVNARSRRYWRNCKAVMPLLWLNSHGWAEVGGNSRNGKNRTLVRRETGKE